MRGDRADHPVVIAAVVAEGGKKITVVAVDESIINNCHCFADTMGRIS